LSKWRRALLAISDTAGRHRSLFRSADDMSFLHRWALRRQITSTLANGKRVSLESAAKLWALSPLIYIGPVGPAARDLPESRLYRIFVESKEVDDRQVEQLLSHQSGVVAGYGFEILLARRSTTMPAAVEKLRGRQEQVAMGLGCVVYYRPLGHYAEGRFKAELGATPNAGPATRPRNSGHAEGPPSVS
jgi:hypothetical protein